MTHNARCLCGAVKVTIQAEPLGARHCWCRVCQYLSAGGGTVNVIFPADAVTSEGEVRWIEGIAESGNAMRRGFCPTCGTQIFSQSSGRPNLMIVRAGALDDPGLASPQSVIWTAEAPNWAHLDPQLPHVERQPPPIA